MNDGTFGTTADCGAIAPELVEAVENHHFPPLKALSWRNSDLRFTSIDALLASLERPPAIAGLVRARDADDQLALATLAKDEEIRTLATHPERVRLLWEVCQIPDFRKVMAETHTRLLSQIFRHLTGPGRRLPADWLANHVRRLDRVDGDLDTLVARIANVRTWTYVSHRGDWVADPAHWQGATRAIEDRLSDALHDRLTQRFVDRRTAVLVRRMRESGPLVSAVARSGDVLVEGHHVGRLVGFRFTPDAAEGANAARAVLAAAGRALKSEIATRVERLVADDDGAFSFAGDGGVLWRGEAVAQLAAGAETLKPQLDLLASDLLEPALRDRVRRRLADWLAAAVAEGLRPLIRAREAPVKGAARGLVHQLAEALGSLPRQAGGAQVSALAEQDRSQLTRLGVRFGVESIFMPALLKPAAQRLRSLLWAAHAGCPPVDPPGEKVALPADPRLPAGFYEAVGYRVMGGSAIRVDMLERFAAEARRLAREARAAGGGGFEPTPVLLSLLGMPVDQAAGVLEALGFERRDHDGRPAFHPVRRPAAETRPRRHPKGHGTESPFAVLRRLGS